MTAAYWDPSIESSVEDEVSGPEIEQLVTALIARRSRRGVPALELRRVDGSLITVGTDGHRAVVSWTNPLQESFASVGSNEASEVLVYDYFGSWTEAPGSALVSLDDALGCLRAFVSTGVPDTDVVLFSPV